MKNHWVIGAIVTGLYLAVMGYATYYFSVPTQLEKESVRVQAETVDANPISEELMQELKDRTQYGDQPIEIEEGRVGKFNPFRI